MNIPSGNITFLFTDIENSAMLAQEFNDKIIESLSRHNLILKESAESSSGFIFKRAGDAYCCAFANADDAVMAAFNSQLKLSSQDLGDRVIRIRIGIHSGQAEWSGSDYTGYMTLARTQRIMSAANGGQILISSDAYENLKGNVPAGISFRDLGERRLKDLIQPMRLYQISAPELPTDFPPLKTLDARPNNLPIQLTSFIGREKEMQEIKNKLSGTRMITLLGPGGTGKTRLSMQTGADLIDDFINGVCITELASLTDPDLISITIARSLKISEQPGQGAEITLVNHLKDKELLLILDNCEHLIEPCAHTVEKLLQNCQQLKIIATSREALRINGETIYSVISLSFPTQKQRYSPEELSRFEAVRLFIERAHSANVNFRVSEENAEALSRICYQLDGIPLAIELAAARIKVLTVEKICDKLNDRFRLLKGGNRTALPRQQTLKALIDWSYDLLTEKEKIFFTYLSVFSGGWSLNAAEKICVDENINEEEVMELMSNLTDKSLVVSTVNEGTAGFTMLESIREYSNEKLPGTSEIYMKHFEYYHDLVKSGDNIVPVNEMAWEKEMISGIDNIRAAMKWSMENIPEESVKFVFKVAQFLELKGNYREALDLLVKLFGLNIKIDDTLKAEAYVNAAFMSCHMDEIENAEKYVIDGLEYFRSTGNTEKTAAALSIYGMIRFLEGDTENAIKYSEESLKLLENNSSNFLSVDVKGNLAAYYSGSGDAEKSMKLLEEVTEYHRENDNKKQLTQSLISIGGVYYQNGDLERAVKCYEEGLTLLEELNDQYTLSVTLYNLGNVNFTQKKYSESLSFYERAMTISKEYGNMGVYDRSHIKLGEIFLIRNENAKAKKIFIDSLKSLNRYSEKLKLNLGIYGLAKYFFNEKDYETAAKLFFLTERISENINFRFSKSRLDEKKLIIDEIRSNLPDNKIELLHDEVQLFEIENAAEIALKMSNELM